MGVPNNNNSYLVKGRPSEEMVLFFTFWMDEDFMETYGLELATPDSRYFSEAFSTDSLACLVIEAAVRKYNLEDPLNQVIMWPTGENEYTELRVIGVMKDHHFSTLKHEIGALIHILKPKSWDWTGYLTLRLEAGKEQEALAFISDKWKEYTNDQPLQYFFLDERLDTYYAEEKRTGAVTLVFSILAIFIASLGLFGLTLYNAQKRIREIGIRKVMGANETNIITMVSGSALISLAIAIALALPVAWYMMRDWLNNFPYNIGFRPELFLISALLVIVIALVTVSLTSLKSARTNPAIALHYE